jgi:hypothetical protein
VWCVVCVRAVGVSVRVSVGVCACVCGWVSAGWGVCACLWVGEYGLGCEVSMCMHHC